MDVRNYFGEKIAYYFLYLDHYILYLIFPAIIGIVVFIINLTLENTDTAARVFNLIFAVVIVVSSSVMYEMWKWK